jgi:L-fuconolactonase
VKVRADAHLHFFYPGYVAALPENCRRIQPDEVTLYEALSQKYNIKQALVVGYEGEPWAAGNNKYLAQLAGSHAWLKPVAFVHDPAYLDVPTLIQWQQNRFVGLSFYLFQHRQGVVLKKTPGEVWDWLVKQGWLISVNSRGEHWAMWLPILENYPQLRLLVSHLGLPSAVAQPPVPDAAQQGLRSILLLAQFPNVHVKLSGFYALTQPGYNYPHQAAWPYVSALLSVFGSRRLLWGSDFSPSLEWVSFPQTFGLFAEMPFLDPSDRERIEGGNLLTLLAELSHT